MSGPETGPDTSPFGLRLPCLGAWRCRGSTCVGGDQVAEERGGAAQIWDECLKGRAQAVLAKRAVLPGTFRNGASRSSRIDATLVDQMSTDPDVVRGKLVPEERRRLILEVLRERRSITVGAVEQQFGVSPMTARSDLAILVREGHARRTHGGAMLPDLAVQDSLRHRLDLEADDKERLARAVVGTLETFYRERTTLKVNVLPEDIAAGILFFASPRRSGKSTANILNVDGGVALAYPR